jgi:predicted double-glycine peptidase
MKSSKYLPSLRSASTVREKHATRGERILGSLFPNRGTGFPGGWSQDRVEQVLHYKNWIYTAVDLICSQIAAITPNLAYVVDAPKPGITTKAGRRGWQDSFGQEPFLSEGGHSYLTMGAYRSKALSVIKPHEELEPLESFHPLRRLMENPNPVDTCFDIAYELQMFEELTGVSYEWLVPNAWGVPCERWCIPSHWVWPRTGGGRYVDPENPHADELIQYYEIRPWGGMGSAGILRFPPNEVLMTRWKSPINKIDGYSKLSAIAQWIDSEESISKSRWSQFQNQARPEFWVELGPGYEDPDDDRIRRVEAKIAAKIQGEYNYGKPLITPPGAKVTPLSFSPTEMAYFECCDANTECLTLNGWVKYDQLTEQTRVACYNQEMDRLEYHQPTRILTQHYRGEMHQWRSDDLDLLVTPGHRLYVQRRNRAGDLRAGSDGSWEIRKIQDLSPREHYRLRVTAPLDAEDPPDVEVPLYKKYAKGEPVLAGTYRINPGDWARFLGWYVSEGHLAKEEDRGFGEGRKRRRRHRIAAASQKIDSCHTSVIDQVVAEVPPYQWRKDICGGKDNRGCYQWCATDRGLYLHLKEHCGSTAREKRLPRYVLGWPSRLLKILLEAALSGDGTDRGVNQQGHHTWIYRTTSKTLADDMVETAVKCGYQATLRHSSGDLKEGCWLVRISSKNYVNVHGEHQSIVPYDGMIWCLTVPTSLFVVRRNGKVHITGNSEEQIRDMILSTFRVPPAAVGIVKEMTYGSILATLSALCTYCLNPRLAMRGLSYTKHLASRWSVPGRQVRIWWDDCVPADPTQVNADIAQDLAAYAITPNEVRALRGRKAYRHGGDDPMGQGPAGVMPIPLHTGEGLGDLAEMIAPMTTAAGRQRSTSEGEVIAEDSGVQEAPPSIPSLQEGVADHQEQEGQIANPNGEPSKQLISRFGERLPWYVRKGESHDYSSTQLEIENQDLLYRILELGEAVSAQDLAEKGREEDPHITVLYGLHTRFPEEIRDCIQGFGPIRATFGRLSLFTQEEAEVLKIEVISSDLHRLHQCLALLEHTDSYSEYSPHLTIAYLVHGRGEHYLSLNQEGIEGVEVLFDRLTFSNPEGERTVISLAPPREESPARVSVPERKLLDLPDIRQEDTYSCGAAAAMSVGRYYGVGPQTLGEWKEALGTSKENSTSPQEIVRYLSKLGLRVSLSGELTLQHLRTAWAAGCPVICPIQEYAGAPEAAFEYGHYVVVIGVALGQVFVQDPAIENALGIPGGTVPLSAENPGILQTPGRSMIPEEVWERIWRDRDAEGTIYRHFGIVVGPPVGSSLDPISVDTLAAWLLKEWQELRSRYRAKTALALAVSRLSRFSIPVPIEKILQVVRRRQAEESRSARGPVNRLEEYQENGQSLGREK